MFVLTPLLFIIWSAGHGGVTEAVAPSALDLQPTTNGAADPAVWQQGTGSDAFPVLCDSPGSAPSI